MNNRTHGIRGACCALLAGPLLTVVAPASAAAQSPVGGCTQSYTPITAEQIASLPDASLATDAFNKVNHNGDDTVCYKQYPNAPHSVYYENFVDNTSGPHS